MNIQGIHPTTVAPMQAQSASNSSSGSSTSGTSASDLQSTFLNLLVTELQNQDPTSPVDPTQMVSQMVSLNELNELVSINQTLTKMASSGTTPASSAATRMNGFRQTQLQPPSSPSRAGSASMQNPGGSIPAAASEFMNLYGVSSMPASNSTHNKTGAR